MKSTSTKFLKIKSLLPKTGIIAAALVLSTPAAADLQVAAMTDGIGAKSLLAGNIERADKLLPNQVSRRLTYMDANNLCVLQILQNHEAAAVSSCQKALWKLKTTSMKRRAKTAIIAELYNNLAVAQYLAGDRAEAERNLGMALSYVDLANDEANNAVLNQLAFQRRNSLAAK